MIPGCPGAINIKGTPTLKLKACPECGGDIEIFSSEMTTNCVNCGFKAYNDAQNCISWCRYAKDCVGEEIFQEFMNAKKEQENNVN